MASTAAPKVDLKILRYEISKEYSEVAQNPQKGFHFHTGRRLAEMLGYDAALLDWIPKGSLESFAGTGNPFSLGEIKASERVVDVGSGAGFDSLIAAKMAGPKGRVVGVDMTPEMLKKAQSGAAQAGLKNVEFKQGLAESLPVEDDGRMW
jgi:arsenite methyltransferase